MAKTTPLKSKFDNLPKNISLKNEIVPLLNKYDITQSTFYRDMEATPSSIPHARLQVYASLLDCEVSDLIDSFVKIKPLVKRKSIGQKVGLKN